MRLNDSGHVQLLKALPFLTALLGNHNKRVSASSLTNLLYVRRITAQHCKSNSCRFHQRACPPIAVRSNCDQSRVCQKVLPGVEPAGPAYVPQMHPSPNGSRVWPTLLLRFPARSLQHPSSDLVAVFHDVKHRQETSMVSKALCGAKFMDVKLWRNRHGTVVLHRVAPAE